MNYKALAIVSYLVGILDLAVCMVTTFQNQPFWIPALFFFKAQCLLVIAFWSSRNIQQ